MSDVISTANNVTALFQIGGTIGAILVGWAMDSLRPAIAIAIATSRRAEGSVLAAASH